MTPPRKPITAIIREKTEKEMEGERERKRQRERERKRRKEIERKRRRERERVISFASTVCRISLLIEAQAQSTVQMKAIRRKQCF